MTAERRDPSRLYGRASTFEGRRAVPSPEERGRLAEQRERLMSKGTKVGKTRHEAEGVSGMDVTAKLAEWETLTEAATEGPWEADGTEITQHWSRPEPWLPIASDDVVCMAYCYGGSARGIESDADAEFIAAAREMVPALLGFVEDVLRLADEADADARGHEPHRPCEAFARKVLADRMRAALTKRLGGEE